MMVKICPNCKKESGMSAIICPYCNTDLYLVVPKMKSITDAGVGGTSRRRVMGPATKIKRAEWINIANKVNDVDNVSGENKVYSSAATNEKVDRAVLQQKRIIDEKPEDIVSKIANADYIEGTSFVDEFPDPEKGVSQTSKYVKYCQVCGAANYLSYKDEYVSACKMCGQDNINNVPTVLAKVEQEDNKKNDVLKEASPIKKEEVKSKSERSPITFKQIPNNKIIEIPNNGGVIGRYGDVCKEYFSSYEHISGNHLRIINEKGEYYIQDLNSTNGTKINGSRINSLIKYKITNGCMISISTLLFEVSID